MIVFDFFDGYARELVEALCQYFLLEYEEVENYLCCGEERTAEEIVEHFNINLADFCSSDVGVVCRHMTTSNPKNVALFKKNGLLDLRSMLQQETSISLFLKERGICIDVDNHILEIAGKQYPILSAGDKCTNCYIGAGKSCEEYYRCDVNKAISRLANKLYYYGATVEFFTFGTLEEIKSYSTVRYYPEILLTISGILSALKGFSIYEDKLGREWMDENKDCYLVEFVSKLSDMETYAPTDYDGAYREIGEFLESAGYDYADYYAHDIPYNFYDNYYLLQVFCRAFYGGSEQMGSLLPEKTIIGSQLKIIKVEED